MEIPAPTAIATGPAQLAYFLSKSRRSISSGVCLRRRYWSQKTTASHGAIQYAMISRKFSYFVPALLSPDQARKNPIVPNTSATSARRSASGSLKPSAVNEIAPE